MINKTSVGRTVKEYAIVTFGILLYVLGWSIFLVTLKETVFVSVDADPKAVSLKKCPLAG